MDINFERKVAVVSKYNVDPITKQPVPIPVTESQQINILKNIIQMLGIPKKNKKIQIIDKDMVAVDRVDKIKEPYHYYVDYDQGLMHFHPDIAGNTIEYKYDNIGVTLVSANRIFTNQDEKGNVIELLSDIIELGREAIDVMKTLGGVAIVIKKLEDSIKEGGEIVLEIESEIQKAKDEVLDIRGNKEVLVKTADWGKLSEDIYQKEITHDLNSENLHVTAKNSNTKDAVIIGYKIVDKSRILIKSDEAINMSIILSASYYHATQTVEDDIVEEVVKARKGELSLDDRMNKTDAEITTLNESLEDSIAGNTDAINELQKNVTQQLEENTNNNKELMDELKSGINSEIEVFKSTIIVSNVSELKQALIKCETTPTIIYLNNGDYVLDSTLYIPSNTKLVGLGIVTVKADGLNCYFSNKCMVGVIGYTGTKNIIIENIIFDGKNKADGLSMLAFAHAENIEIVNCIFKDLHMWHMIEFNAVMHGTIRKCTFKNYGNVGSNCTEAIQLDSMISQDQFPWFGSYDDTSCRFISIEDNVFEDIGSIAIGNHSFKIGVTLKDINISNNYFNNIGTCINLSDFDTLLIAKNHAYSCHGFFMSKNEKNDCRGLTIVENRYQGFFINSIDGLGDERFVGINVTGIAEDKNYVNVIISKNDVSLIPGHAIGLIADYLTITDNNFYRVYRNGIYHFGGYTGVISNNTFRDIGMEGGFRKSILINGGGKKSERVTVMGNTIANLHGINISGAVDKILVSGNIGIVTNEVGDKCTATNNIN